MRQEWLTFCKRGWGSRCLIAAQSLLIIGFVMISLLFLVYGDRKIWAAVQMRRGPNVVGPFGLLQSVADALKYVVKEIVMPGGGGPAGVLSGADAVLRAGDAGLGGDPVQ
jgi:NADH:ubiquinone oxidoreductase subunit H